MKKIDTATSAHIRGEVTTLCRCWIIDLVDGVRFGFTDHDENNEVNGVLCERDAGAESSSVEERIGLNIDASEIHGALQSDRITADDINSGKYDGGKITTYFVNWKAPGQHFIDQVLLIGEITQQDGVFRFELQSMTSMLDHTRGRHFIKRCQADLGDVRCKVALDTSGFSGVGTVAEILSPYSLEISGLDDFEPNWFSFGHLRWISGKNDGRGIEVAIHVVEDGIVRLTLWQAMSAAVDVGDTFTITTGCDKTFKTCKEKFSNSLNFQGFPHMPGDGFAVSHAANADDFDGEPLIP